MTFDYFNGVNKEVMIWLFNGHSKSKVQSADNDNKRKTANMIANPGKALCDAVINNDPEKFFWQFGHSRVKPDAINKAFFLAVGFERKDIEAAIIHRLSELSDESMSIRIMERPNGILLRGVLHGNPHSVVVSLRNPSVDVNCHQDECFKQAILRNDLKIADLLHGAGADIPGVYADEDFMDKVNKCDAGITSETRSYVWRVVGNDDRSVMVEPELTL